MRIIDADALLKRKGCAYDSEGHLLFAVGTGDIVHAPTIPAIPVEWIENMLKEWLKSSASFETCGAISAMLVRWQKEQEAR